MQVNLLRTGVLAHPDEITRAWIEPGGVLKLAGGCLLTYLVHRNSDDEHRPELCLHLPNGVTCFRVNLEAPPLDASPFAPLCIVPRALEINGERPERLLVELVSLGMARAG